MIQDRIEALKSRISPVSEKLEDLRQQLKASCVQQDRLVVDVAENRQKLEFQTECVEWAKKILEKRGAEHLEKITSLCSLALQTVFPDRNYQFLIQVEEKRGSNTANFTLWEQLESGETVEAPFTEIGGSVRTVVGLTLQVYFINYYNLFPVLYLDESLGSLSVDYIPTLMTFLRELCEQQGMIFVLISHDKRIFEYVDKTYEVHHNSAHLKS